MMRTFLSFVFLTLIFVTLTPAAEPAIWSVNSRSEVLKGESRGVSIGSNGTITLAPKLQELYKTEQPYVWSSTFDTAGNVYLGTGGDGKIFKVNSAGTGSLLTDLTELNVSALVIGRGGELFAATSPDGKVYQIDQAGKAVVYFDPKEKYIWSLAAMPDGSLAIATGDGGKIYRVRSANAIPAESILFDTSETHIISLAVDSNGNLYAGTDSNGLVLKFGRNGRPFAVIDSPLREIHELAAGPDGTMYALALGDSASAAVPSATPLPVAAGESKTVTAGKTANPAPTPQKSRYDLAGARSAVYRLTSDGGNEIIWSSPTVTGFSLYAHKTGNGVLIGTSDRGRIYSVDNSGNERLVLQSDAGQISNIFNIGQNLYAASSNQGKLYRFGSELVAEGSYESPVFDAKSIAKWGSIWWRSTGSVQIETRSGNSEEPNETWGPWEPVLDSPQRGRVKSQQSRFLQWRAIFKNASAEASLTEVNVALLPGNIAPEVLSISILPPNLGLIANPPVPVDPNIELSGLDPQLFGIPNQPVAPRRVFQRAARSFQWTAEDRNGDKLVYDVYFKEVNESAFKLLRENIVENFVAIDGQSLADGRYVVRIVAKDSPENPAGLSLAGERVSEPFDIDNTQPTVTADSPQISGEAGRVTFTAIDRTSYLVRAEYSVNGGRWMPVYAADGISDSGNEQYRVELSLPALGEYVVTLRAFDASGNSGSARAVLRK